MVEAAGSLFHRHDAAVTAAHAASHDPLDRDLAAAVMLGGRLRGGVEHALGTACVDQDPREGMYLGSPVEAALQQLGALDGYRVYLCGHPDLVKTAQRKCFMAGANMRDISADPFLPT